MCKIQVFWTYFSHKPPDKIQNEKAGMGAKSISDSHHLYTRSSTSWSPASSACFASPQTLVSAARWRVAERVVPGRCQAPTQTSSTTSKRNYKSFQPEPIHGLGPSLSVLSTSQLESPQHLQAENERSVQQWNSFIPRLITSYNNHNTSQAN